MVNTLFEFLLKLSTVCTSSVPSFITSVCTSSVLSVNLSDVEHHEILDEFPGTKYGEYYVGKFLHDVTLNLNWERILMKTPGNFNREN